MFRLLITGSRSWSDVAVIEREFEVVAEHEGANVMLVSGGAKGADTLCEQVAEKYGWVVERHLPDWSVGKRAGFDRNKVMVDSGADFCLAFILDDSAGATQCSRIAKEAKIPTKRIKANSPKNWVVDYVKGGE